MNISSGQFIVSDGGEVEITALGGQGDGIAGAAGERVFVPFALPGERWAKAGAGYALSGPGSAERIAPKCRHFGVCGGCVAQHMAPDLYAKWKRQILVDALQAADINAAVEPLQAMPVAARRRVVLSARMLPEGVALGFHERGTRLLAIEECPIADPAITVSIPVLRRLAGKLLRHQDEMRMTVTRVDAGLDVAVEGGKKGLGAADLASLSDLLAGSNVLRLSLDRDPIITRSQPVMTLGGVEVVPPAGVFVQAHPAAEALMVEIVTGAVGKAKAVADLFSGLGTFALPLAKRAKVLAIDNDSKALEALSAAHRNARGLKPIETRTRDLMREPLSRKELEPFDAVVFDPPRAGAQTQAEALAKSQVSVVVAVSCNPTTLARDAAILLDAGFAVKRVVPIDQFVYSNHLEAVAVFERAKGRRK